MLQLEGEMRVSICVRKRDISAVKAITVESRQVPAGYDIIRLIAQCFLAQLR